jgi:DNA-binding NtrC family response regulator
LPEFRRIHASRKLPVFLLRRDPQCLYRNNYRSHQISYRTGWDKVMEHGDGSRTLSLITREASRKHVQAAPHLFLVTQAGHDREPALRVRLDGLDEIWLSRSSQRRLDRSANAAGQVLRIGVADHWMSIGHAAVIRDGERWRLDDRGSTNGTRINGQPRRTAVLGDGDLIEIGRTFLVFRAGLTTRTQALRALDAGTLDALPGLATILPELTERFDELARLADSKMPIVLRGPTGSGKELLARAVHQLSGRSGAFIAVNCAGLPETLVESELFGNVRGAFTGAVADRDGLIAAAAGGTLFLDEVGELPLNVQSKLLRALQEQAVRPVGGTTERRVDLRVVAATHHDLDRLVEAGRFRDDLLARLGGSFVLPALRERREDLGLLVDALLGQIEDPRARRAELSAEAVRALFAYSWPRNIRELHNALARAIALAGAGPIELEHLPPEVQQAAGDERPPAPEPALVVLTTAEQARRARLLELMLVHRGNIAAIARELGTVRSQIQRWMKRYGIARDDAGCRDTR